MPSCSPAIEIAWAYKELGQADNYVKLINECKYLYQEQKKSSIAYFELDYLAARIYALEGQPTQAVQFLSKAIDDGWREWWTQYDPLLKSLKDDAEFQKLLEFIEADLTRQRQEAKRLFLK
ncbi:MAG: hypothetical protein NWQ54_11125, partial [Paraglaciecola sp.]|nr:hypothetical protein [Paraglaciecola sp.]